MDIHYLGNELEYIQIAWVRMDPKIVLLLIKGHDKSRAIVKNRDYLGFQTMEQITAWTHQIDQYIFRSF